MGNEPHLPGMTNPAPNLVFDFDSTLVTVEGADELFRHSLEHSQEAPAEQRQRMSRFQELTDRGMAGEISYEESFAARMALLDLSIEEVRQVAESLVGHLTPSVRRCRAEFRAHADRIWIVSGGFEELIVPVADWLGIERARIRAHRLRFDPAGRLEGVDPGTAMARGGKPRALRELDLSGPVWVIGDGATDLELREEGLAHRFFAFVENRSRPAVVAGADHALQTIEDIFTWPS